MQDLLNELAEADKYGWQLVRGYACYLPSPEEIRDRCNEIQTDWSDDERYKRRTSMPYQVGMKVNPNRGIHSPSSSFYVRSLKTSAVDDRYAPKISHFGGMDR